MGAKDRSIYGILEHDSKDAPVEHPDSPFETRSGVVKDNVVVEIEEQRPPGAFEAGRSRICEPAVIMADKELIQTDRKTATPTQDDAFVNALMGKTYEEKSIWANLWENTLDVFFPRKLPPLELTSKPIPVPDRMAVKANPWAIGFSTAVNVAILLVLLFFVGKKVIQQVIAPKVNVTDVTVSEFKGLKQKTSAGGGGGGGNNSPVEASKGKLPKLEKNPVVAPQVAVIEKPKLAIEAAINVQKELQLPDNPMLPNIGVKNSANVHLASNGQGSGGGMGNGSGGGLGSGHGNGYGPGEGGNANGGLYRLGGGDTKPTVLYSIDPEFSDEARRAKYQGVCLIAVIVDAQGNPQNPRVVRALGMGLDEKALEAVRKYKFKPALRGGRTPVAVLITIEVNFRLY